MLGFPELLMILAVVLVVFGAGKASDLGKALGKGIHDFNRVKEEGEKLLKEPLKEVENLPKLVASLSATPPEAVEPKPAKEHPPGNTSP